MQERGDDDPKSTRRHVHANSVWRQTDRQTDRQCDLCSNHRTLASELVIAQSRSIFPEAQGKVVEVNLCSETSTANHSIELTAAVP